MKSKKLLQSLMVLSILCLVATGCAKAPAEPAVTESAPQQKEPEKTVSTETTSPVSSGNDGLYSFNVQLNDTDLTLPDSFEALEKAGWKGESFDAITLKPDQYTLEQIKNGSKTVMVELINHSQDEQPLTKCSLGGVQIDSMDAKNGTTLTLPEGITIDSKYDDIIKAYGKPTTSDNINGYKILNYTSEIYSDVVFDFNENSDSLNRIRIVNLNSQNYSKAPVSGEKPAVVASYVAPTELGEDLYSFNVKYANDLYHLPAPVSEFVKNGWTILGDQNTVVKASDFYSGVMIRKNNQSFSGYMNNYSDKAAPMGYCFITDLKSSVNTPDVEIELPKGITRNSTLQQVKEAYGEPTSIEDSGDDVYYNYETKDGGVSFYGNKATGKIDTITIKNDPRNLD